jgi:hypothetical protein
MAADKNKTDGSSGKKEPEKPKTSRSNETSGTPSKKKSKVPIALIIVGIVLLCCACTAAAGGLYWFLRDKEGPVYSEEPSVDILTPTGVTWYSTDTDSISLTGTAFDADGTISKVEWSIAGGQSGSADGKDSWQINAISLTEGDNKITVTATDNKGNKGTDQIFVVYNKDVLFVGEPTANPDFLFKDDPPVDVTFSIRIKKSANQELTSVKLVEVDQDGNVVSEVGAMNDSGKPAEGDDVPGDGTYGYLTQLSSDTSQAKHYRVVAQSSGSDTPSMSGVMKLLVVDHVSQNTLNEIENLNNQVNDLMSQLNQQGASIQDMANQINDLVGQQPGIAGNGISEQGTGVWWVYENTCIPGGVLITEPGVKGGSSARSGTLTSMALGKSSLQLVTKANAQGTGPEVQNTKALYLGPYIDDFGQTDDYYGAWELIKTSTCPQCETVEKLGTDVTVDDFKTLSNYGLILVSSHGDNWYGGLSGDNICAEGLQQSQVITYTNQTLTAENLPKYEADLMARRLAVGVNGKLVVLPSYISHYNGNFPNSLVYIATCRSSYNNTLQSAFLGKGAKAYYGFDDYVLSSYCFDVGKELFDNFVLQGDTSQTSFSDATSAIGSSDGQGADFLWSGDSGLRMGGKSFVNTGFESGDFNGWSIDGDSRIIFTLGPIKPTEGDYMSIISTGLGSVSDSKSNFTQDVCLGTTGDTLSFDYNLVSEEPTEYLNSEFDDKLDVYLVVNGNSTRIMSKGVNNSTWNAVNGIDFDGGDSTTFMTGWQTFTYSLADVQQGSSVQIKFEVSDVGDSQYDTAALIDNVKVE